MDARTLEAVRMRLDTRCVKWPFILTGFESRCGECDGCIAHRWLSRGAD